MATGRTEPAHGIVDAEARYLERVVEDIEGILGQGIEIDDVDIVAMDPADGDGPIGLRARYRLDAMSFETVATGESLVDAHSRLRARLVIDRLRLGFTDAVGHARRVRR